MKVPAFFYGSYMDPDTLREFGAEPGTPVRASVAGWRLSFTPHANLVPDKDGAVEGFVFEFSHDQLDRLYGPEGFVTTYKPVPVIAAVGDSMQPALTFVEDAEPTSPDAAYLEAYLGICQKVGLPGPYVAAVASEAEGLEAQKAPA